MKREIKIKKILKKTGAKWCKFYFYNKDNQTLKTNKQ